MLTAGVAQLKPLVLRSRALLIVIDRAATTGIRTTPGNHPNTDELVFPGPLENKAVLFPSLMGTTRFRNRDADSANQKIAEYFISVKVFLALPHRRHRHHHDDPAKAPTALAGDGSYHH